MRARKISILTAVFVLFSVAVWAVPPDPAKLLEDGNDAFKEKTYSDAVPAYEDFLKHAPADHAERPDVEIKLIKSLGHLRKYEKAFERAKGFAAARKDTIWDARIHRVMGGLYLWKPHYGYKKDGVISWGRWVQGATYVNAFQTDLEEAVKVFERSRTILGDLSNRMDELSEDEVPKALERVNTNFDLAKALMQLNQQYYNVVREAFVLGKNRTYGKEFNIEEKLLYIFGETYKISRRSDLQNQAANALYQKAMYFVRHTNSRYYYYQGLDSGAVPHQGQASIPEAIQRYRDPLPSLRRLIARHSKSPLVVEARLALGLVLVSKGDYIAAKESFQNIIDRHDGHKRVTDAKHYIERIERETLSVSSLGHVSPGEEANVTITSRNLKKVKVRVHTFQLEEYCRSNKVLNDYYTPMGGVNRPGINHVKKYAGRVVGEIEVDTKDAGTHKQNSSKTALPGCEKIGPYLVVVEGQDMTAYTLCIVTDIAMVKKMDRDRIFIFAVTAKEGKPVPGGRVLLKERYVRTQGWTHHVRSKKGTTSRLGLWVTDRIRNSPIEPSVRPESVDALVMAGSNRFCLSTQAHSYFYNRSNTKQKAFVQTDRPVYRPKHTVKFKSIVRTLNGGQYTMAPNENIRIQIHSPLGEQLLDEVLKTGPFGTVHGELALGKGAKLGTYRISTQIQSKRGGVHQSNGSNFRVEEYKKPEVEVTVAPGKTHIKVGGEGSAKIMARYYFGGPVADAKVTYRVFRESFTHTYYRPGPYDWLYGYGYGLRYSENIWRRYWHWSNPRRGRELVTNGEGKTDAEGNLEIKFDTAPYAKGDYANVDHRFRIECQVTDESRRVINGKGTVTATRQAFYAHVNTRRGFYRPGDRTEILIDCMTPSNVPVAAEGTISVHQVEQVDTGKIGKNGHKIFEEQLTKVHSEIADTDSAGHGFYRWEAGKSGRYRIQFETKDEWGGVVLGRRDLWVADRDFDGNRFRFTGVELHTEKRSYKQGDTMRLLLNVEQKGASVFLTQEAGNEVIAHTVIKLKGHSRVLEIPMDTEHVPNFYLTATVVWGNEVHVERREIFCPPADRFLDVSVKTDKPTYQPGEVGNIEVTVKDNEGRPVVAEVALTAFDKSVLYIQPDRSGDIRTFFHGDRRGMFPAPFSSWRFRSNGLTIDGRAQITYRTHGMPFAWHRGWGNKFEDRDYDLAEGDDNESDGYSFGGAYKDGGEKSKRSKSEGRAMESESADSFAPPSPKPSAPAPGRKLDANLQGVLGDKKGNRQNQELTSEESGPEIKMRSNFVDTALWEPVLVTGTNGRVKTRITFPDNLTTWNVGARAVTKDTKIGQSGASCLTKKDVIVRLQAPRFFTERDEVTLSGVVHNNLDETQVIEATIDVPGALLASIDTEPRRFKLEGHGVKRVDWRVRAAREGLAQITMTARGEKAGDAMQMKVPVYVHGIETFIARNGVISKKKFRGESRVSIDVPYQRKEGSTSLSISVTPSLASSMLDALPYLAEYPYGCIEQTMSRFIPTVLTVRTLQDLGLNIEDIAEKRAEIAAKHLASRQWSRFRTEPVFSTEVLEDMIQVGLDRIYSMQKSDGGWGWWGGGNSDVYMSAYVMYGLQLAVEADRPIRKPVLDRGYRFLKAHVANDTSLYRKAFSSLVLAKGKHFDKKVADRVYKKRDNLNLYGQALLALAYHHGGEKEKAQILVRNLKDHAKPDKQNNTVRFLGEQTYWWFWYNDEVEANAWILKALVQIDPENNFGPGLVRWMLNNRQGMRWKSTRTTAYCVFAMSDFIRAQNELDPDMTVTVRLGDKVLRKLQITRENALTFDNQILLRDSEVSGGRQSIRITKEGRGTLYYTADLETFTKEEDVPAQGHELFVRRTYTKLVPKVIEKTVGSHKQDRLTYERITLESGSRVESGDLIECRLNIESKNDYEYLAFEDRKPAGLEAVELKSGYRWDKGVGMYREFRDEKVVFFVDWLQQGTHSMAYQLRAEIPGKFHALPVKGYAMYTPRVKGNSNEWRVTIVDPVDEPGTR